MRELWEFVQLHAICKENKILSLDSRDDNFYILKGTYYDELYAYAFTLHEEVIHLEVIPFP